MFPLLLQTIISNQMRPRRLRGAWFSRLLRHPARRRSGSILRPGTHTGCPVANGLRELKKAAACYICHWWMSADFLMTQNLLRITVGAYRPVISAQSVSLGTVFSLLERFASHNSMSFARGAKLQGGAQTGHTC